MRVKELDQEHIHVGEWVVDWSRTGQCDYSDMAAVIRAHRPVLQLDLLQVLRPQLNEATYRDLMARIDPDFLRQGLRVQNTYTLPPDRTRYQGPKILSGISYQGFNGDTMRFVVTPSTEYRLRQKPAFYDTAIKFLNWDNVGGDPNLTPKEKASLLLWTSDVQLHCSDPSFLYWGYQYILTQLGAAIVPENRYPDVRNPGLRGIVCKHLHRVLRVLPFYNADISKAVVAQWGGQIDKNAIDAIRRRADLQRLENQRNRELPPEADVPPPEAEQAPEETSNLENPDEIPPTA